MRISMISLVLSFALVACGSEAAPAPAPAAAAPSTAAPSTAAAAPAPTAEAPAAPAGGDPTVCCEFNGAAGSSTRSLCEQFHGTVLPNERCPGM